ncbi:MAG: N-6 DNA methylase [Gammaproteobacteria bacterium]|nr:N-6 DNA methylase [Gammaproteobacteria bacterium]
MNSALAQPLSAQWKDRLDLSNREIPELYEDPAAVGRNPHANAIRMTLEDLGASAVFCVQGVPTVVIVVLDDYQRERVIKLHGALWNQGLAALLLVISGNTLRAFSLARIPQSDDPEFESRCLIRQLDAVADGLAIKDFIYGAESGRLWQHHADHFKASERIDQVLLDNLSASHAALCRDGLPVDAAQALLIQTMFVAYLEDRNIIGPEYFSIATGGASVTFLGLLESTNATGLNRLFDSLREDFNGDLFVAPCSFEENGPRPRVVQTYLQTLARFRSGREVMGATGGQLRFWGYDFKYIPIELISAVYDRFLGAQTAQRRARGAYYTPMFLADTVISALWETLPASTKSKGKFLDPACGSGVFLVRSFQLLCEHWRETRRSQTIRWDSLLRILSRLRGCDVNAGAVRVAVFSLYVALLQEVDPPDIQLLIKRGRLLPELWGHTLCAQDFFLASEEELQAEVILGNPPWSSRRGADRNSVVWCEENHVPMPGREDAWAFVWKSLRHLREHGVVSFLLPAMGFLHNHAKYAIEARSQLFADARIFRIINFADLRFQLFEGAVRPTALMIFGRREKDAPGYRFDYWAPKADLNLKMRRTITLSSADRGAITTMDLREDPFVFKRRLWMSNPEAKLFNYLDTLPKLGALVSQYRSAYRRLELFENRWVVGNGFQPVKEDRLDDDDYQRHQSEMISNMSYLPIQAFRSLAQDTSQLRVFDERQDGLVRRRGFERGFTGPRVLVPRGISTANHRLRASYLEDPLTFEDIILAVSAPDRDSHRAKLLTALLNSKLLYWFAFHGTASFGSDRPEIQQAELLRLPFPAPEDFGHDVRSPVAASALVSLIDDAMASARESFELDADDDGLLAELDSHCYRYFGLDVDEIALVEDSVASVIPSVQPHTGSFADLWRTAGREEREKYASKLSDSMAQWFSDDMAVRVELEARNNDLALIHLRLVEHQDWEAYQERNDKAVGAALARLGAHMDVPLPGNFQLVPDFRLFTGKSLYLVKPLQRRFWLRSAAIADADAMALDLQDAVQFGNLGHTA